MRKKSTNPLARLLAALLACLLLSACASQSAPQPDPAPNGEPAEPRALTVAITGVQDRSEERRVGKECAA